MKNLIFMDQYTDIIDHYENSFYITIMLEVETLILILQERVFQRSVIRNGDGVPFACRI